MSSQKYTAFNIKTKFTLNYLKSEATGLFLGTQERVQNTCGKRAIRVRVIEVLLQFERSMFLNVLYAMLYSNYT